MDGGESQETVVDLVCGMKVRPATAKGGSHEHAGRTYSFCSPKCRAKFAADPETYLNAPPPERGAPAAYAAPAAHDGGHSAPTAAADGEGRPAPAPPAAPAGAAYVCPMAPEVRAAAPGDCPKCGMALEPRVVTAEEKNPEIEDVTRRFWICAALAVPLLVMAMADMIPGTPIQHALGPALPWIQLALAMPVVLWGGAPFFARGWASIKNRHPNMFMLIALGTGVAYAYSVVAMIAPGLSRAIGCERGRARRSRSTEWRSRGKARWTSRWSPASRSRSRSGPATGSSGAQ